MFGFRRDQTESAVAPGATVMVPVDGAHGRGASLMVVMVLMVVLVIVLDELEEARMRWLRCGGCDGCGGGRGDRRSVAAIAARANDTATTSRGHGRRTERRRRRRWRRARPDDGRRWRPLDRHAKVDRGGHCDLHCRPEIRVRSYYLRLRSRKNRILLQPEFRVRPEAATMRDRGRLTLLVAIASVTVDFPKSCTFVYPWIVVIVYNIYTMNILYSTMWLRRYRQCARTHTVYGAARRTDGMHVIRSGR